MKKYTFCDTFLIFLAFQLQSFQAVQLDNDPENAIEEPLFLDKIKEGFEIVRKVFSPDPDPGSIAFLVYKPSGKKWTKVTDGNLSKIDSSSLKAGKPFKIAIHGFLANCTSTNFPQAIFKAYSGRKKKDYNMICVDWGVMAIPDTITEIAALFHYPKAVNNTALVGEALEKVLAALVKSGHIKDKAVLDVHLIGHSLGAHIAGVAGHEVMRKSKKKRKIARITGLDPAGPAFYKRGDEDKLKLGKGDAAFVDVIHSNMGQLGSKENLGHVNFIPNGGFRQPFCKKENFLEDLSEKTTGTCSHAASSGMFTKSIREAIKACKCNSWEAFAKSNGTCSNKAFLGDRVSTKERGTFCLRLKSI